MTLSLVPRLTAYDPAAEGEGSLDPLGLEAAAERLAEQLVPGMTARMHRVRGLTFMAVSGHVTQPYIEEYTADQTTPAFLVFEWMFAEAMAVEGAETSAIPGIQTAAKALGGGGRLASRIYLKSPRALGLHGFYRRLARAVRVIDEGDYLGENGDALVKKWERDRRLDGFFNGEGEGGKVLDALRHDLEQGLRSSRSCLRERSRGGLALRRSLTPRFPKGSSRERKELRRILDEDEQRRETLSLLEAGMQANAFNEDEEAMAEWIAAKGSPQLAASAQALLAFERLARLLSEAFEVLLWSSSRSQMVPRKTAQLVTERHGEIAKMLPAALRAVGKASESVEPDQGREQLVDSFDEVRSGTQLAEALLSRHYTVQAGKSRMGKRPWFERTERGLAVRPGYARTEEPATPTGFIHQTRLRNGCEFLGELA